MVTKKSVENWKNFLNGAWLGAWWFSRIWQHHPSEICSPLNWQHKFFSKPDWNSYVKLIPFSRSLFSFFLLLISGIAIWMHHHFSIFILKSILKAWFGSLKTSTLAFYNLWKCPFSRSFKRETVRKSFPHFYLLSPFSLLPSFFFAFFLLPLLSILWRIWSICMTVPP